MNLSIPTRLAVWPPAIVSTHSIRFARHDRPCHPSVQFAPYPPKICAKKQDFRLYYSARRATISKIRRRAEDRRALPAVTEALRLGAMGRNGSVIDLTSQIDELVLGCP